MPISDAARHLHIFSHDQQIRWYTAFAEAFRELGPEFRTVLFVHGPEDARLGREAQCYDHVVDLLEGFEFDEGLEAAEVPIHPAIRHLERESGVSFLWEDIKCDRWIRARNDTAFALQYLNHAVSRLLETEARLPSVAGLGEYTMAIYRLAYRFLAAQGKRMFYPITTRWYRRLYFETSLYWEWESCMRLYARYLQEGVPALLEGEVAPVLDGILSKYGKPTYTQYQNRFATGYTQLSRLDPRAALGKVARAFRTVDRTECRRNVRLSLLERSPLQKVNRMLMERRNHRTYAQFTSEALPPGLDYGVYFLHYQPEYTSESLGHFYAEQQFLIRNIASSLPAGMFLVVKEHPTMVGLRDPVVYEHIRANANVLLVHHGVDSVELIQGARIVFTIVGTPALEAMFLGKPAVMFGRYAFADTNLISLCRDLWQLASLVREKLAQRSDPADVRRHALALLAAKHAASRPGQVPLAVEFVEPFCQDRENFQTVKASFVAELASQGILACASI